MGSPPHPPVTWGNVPDCAGRGNFQRQNVAPHPQSESLTYVWAHTRTHKRTNGAK